MANEKYPVTYFWDDKTKSIRFEIPHGAELFQEDADTISRIQTANRLHDIQHELSQLVSANS